MRPLNYRRASDPSSAVQALVAAAASNEPLTQASVLPLAGGTTLIDLMKLDVMRPSTLVDITPLASAWSGIRLEDGSLKLGALAHMSDVAGHPEVQRGYPVIADSLKLAASPQLRNMASLGGNVLQRTRCPYFRDTSYFYCVTKFRCCGLTFWRQHGHRGRVLAMAWAKRMRVVAIEFGMCRSGRNGGSSGSVTCGNDRLREDRDGTCC